MQLRIKERVSYLAALSILFSIFELFIPKPFPFFRLGFANLPILISLDLTFKPFLLLLFLKAIGSAYVSGNLFSPFVLISLMQTLASGFVMKTLFRIFKTKISRYGLSLAGALASSYTQLYVASLYIGKTVWFYLPFLLISSLISSLIVAYFSYKITIDRVPELTGEVVHDTTSYIPIVTLLTVSILIWITDSLLFSFLGVVLALLFQLSSGRKIKIIPHITIILFMIISSLFAPEGRILFALGPIRVTELSLESALIKSFHISSAVAISQAYTNYITINGRIISLVFEYFSALLAAFNESKGTIKERITDTLNLTTLKRQKPKNRKKSYLIILFFTILFTINTLISFIMK